MTPTDFADEPQDQRPDESVPADDGGMDMGSVNTIPSEWPKTERSQRAGTVLFRASATGYGAAQATGLCPQQTLRARSISLLERLGAPPEAYTDPVVFTQFALPRPLGVQRRRGVEARNLCTEVDFDGRSIGGGGAIDHGGLVWAMTGDEESILAATDAACEEALAGLGDHEPVGLLAFSCAALRAVLGDDGIQREGARMAKWAQEAPLAGFYTYGEIARVRGIDGFHNQTLVVLALG